jgi:hypothetical protein
MARKARQITSRGQSTWLVRLYLGRDPQTGTRKYHSQTIHGPVREAHRCLNLKLQQRDNARVPRAAVLSVNQLLDQWLSTQGTGQDEKVSRLLSASTAELRPVLGIRLIGTITQWTCKASMLKCSSADYPPTRSSTQCCPPIGFSPSSPLEDAGRGSMHRSGPSSRKAE